MNFFIEGLLLGYAYAMPIGPQNLFVIDSALKAKRSQALSTAFIVGIMDVSLALACFWGIGLTVHHVPVLKNVMMALGALFLISFAVRLLVSRSTESANGITARSWRILSVIQLCFILTWLNPQALIDGSILFGGYSAKLQGSSPVLFLGGMTTASFSWFFVLTLLISLLRNRLSTSFIRSINILCGLIMFCLGIKMAYEFYHGVML